MHLNGLVLDFYDDQASGTSVLRSIYPEAGDVPDLVKTAHALTPEEREQLPDSVYALVMDVGGAVLRKYACVDAGNTQLAIEYFLTSRSTFPEEVQKVAAANLVTACRWYELAPPVELQKIAGLGMMAVGTALTVPPAVNAAKKGVRDAYAQGGVVTPKHAEVAGTAVQPMQEDVDPPAQTKAVVKKAAMPGGKYPLDTFEQVKAACQYFEDYWRDFAPSDRHTFAVNTVKVATDFGVPIGENLNRYGSEKAAAVGVVHMGLDMRREHVPAHVGAALGKLASHVGTVGPGVLAAAIELLDKEAGITDLYDVAVLDPYAFVYGEVKTAAFSEDVGGVYVNEFMLEQLAVSNAPALVSTFGAEFAKEFKQDPVGIFSSMPREEKVLLARMATGG